MPDAKTNPFSRNLYGSSSYTSNWLSNDEQADLGGEKQTFTGADLQAYINNRRVGNLESVTCSISVEVVPVYDMGRRDPVAYSTGKRVIVGSIVFSQFNKHAFLEEVWKLNSGSNPMKVRQLGDLWGYDTDTVGAVASSALRQASIAQGSIASIRTGYVYEENKDIGSLTGTLRGLSPQEFDRQLREQLLQTLRVVGSQKIRYSDQIPPFDLTLVGVNTAGHAARCAIFGMRITQETFGFSSSDLSNAVGMSYVALAVDPWQSIETSGGSIVIPPTR